MKDRGNGTSRKVVYFFFNSVNLVFLFILMFFNWHYWTPELKITAVMVFAIYELLVYFLFHRWEMYWRQYFNSNEPYQKALSELQQGNLILEESFNSSEYNAAKRIKKIQKGLQYYHQTKRKFNEDAYYLTEVIKEKNIELLEKNKKIENQIHEIQKVTQQVKIIVNNTFDPAVLLDESGKILWKNSSFTQNYIEMTEENKVDTDFIQTQFPYREHQIAILKDKAIRLEKIQQLRQSKDFHFMHITKRNLELKHDISLIHLVDNILGSISEIIGQFYLKLFILNSEGVWVERKSSLKWELPKEIDFNFHAFMTKEWTKHPKLEIYELDSPFGKNLVIAPLETERGLQAAYGLILNDQINENDKQTIKLFYNQFTMVVQREVIYQTLRNQYFNTIEALVNVIEAKDKYTEGHSRRVSRFAVEIAKKLGYTKEEVERVEISGLLHDVGKIGIEQAILVKQGRLSDEEYSEMKRHPEKAIQILEAIDLESDIMDGILYHHLRYDLKGYPMVKLDALPIFASIIGTADAFDAITSARSYSGKQSVEDAVKELIKYKGSQFDPQIVDTMLQIIKEDRDRIESIINDDAFTKRELKGEYHVLSSTI